VKKKDKFPIFVMTLKKNKPINQVAKTHSLRTVITLFFLIFIFHSTFMDQSIQSLTYCFIVIWRIDLKNRITRILSKSSEICDHIVLVYLITFRVIEFFFIDFLDDSGHFFKDKRLYTNNKSNKSIKQFWQSLGVLSFQLRDFSFSG
jgi:hypothetical protein